MQFISKSILSCVISISNFICVKISMRYFLIAFSQHKQTKIMIEVNKESNMFRIKSFRVNLTLKKFQKISIKIKWMISIVKRLYERFLSLYEMIVKAMLIKIILDQYSHFYRFTNRFLIIWCISFDVFQTFDNHLIHNETWRDHESFAWSWLINH